MTDRPLILVTNDDGIFAPGIRNLVEEVKAFGRVLVVAPDKPQSAMGHAITIHSYLRLNKVEFPASGPGNAQGVEAWSCSGTPVDCVKLAINKLLCATAYAPTSRSAAHRTRCATRWRWTSRTSISS